MSCLKQPREKKKPLRRNYKAQLALPFPSSLSPLRLALLAFQLCCSVAICRRELFDSPPGLALPALDVIRPGPLF